jgi:hypothetical protein
MASAQRSVSGFLLTGMGNFVDWWMQQIVRQKQKRNDRRHGEFKSWKSNKAVLRLLCLECVCGCVCFYPAFFSLSARLQNRARKPRKRINTNKNGPEK